MLRPPAGCGPGEEIEHVVELELLGAGHEQVQLLDGQTLAVGGDLDELAVDGAEVAPAAAQQQLGSARWEREVARACTSVSNQCRRSPGRNEG